MSAARICGQCQQPFWGAECDLCGPMAKAFARMASEPRKRRGEGRRVKVEDRRPAYQRERKEWGADRSLPKGDRD